jgi:hypothetical protein
VDVVSAVLVEVDVDDLPLPDSAAVYLSELELFIAALDYFSQDLATRSPEASRSSTSTSARR